MCCHEQETVKRRSRELRDVLFEEASFFSCSAIEIVNVFYKSTSQCTSLVRGIYSKQPIVGLTQEWFREYGDTV